MVPPRYISLQGKAVNSLNNKSLFALAILLFLADAFFAQAAFAQPSPFGGGVPRPPMAEPASGLAAWFLTMQASFHQSMTRAIAAIRDGRESIMPLLALAFGYGVVHAIGPGHGKAVIAAYLVANEGTLKRGIALAFGAAATQGVIALLIVALVAWGTGGNARTMEGVADWVESLGFAIIFAMGLWIMLRKARALFFPHHHVAGESCDACHHQHGGDVEMLSQASPRALILTAMGAGARPCSGAIILLVFALTQGLFIAGALSVLVMAVGTALGTSLFAILAVKAKHVALRIAGRRAGVGRTLLLVLEALAGLALALLGLALLIGVMAGNT